MTQKQKKQSSTTVQQQTPPQPPTLNDFLIHSFCVGKETTSNGALKLESSGDWGLAIYRVQMGDRYGIHSPEDFIATLLNADYWRQDEMEVYDSMDLMSMLELMPVELEELKPAKSKTKTIETLPVKFGKCIRTCCNGNAKGFVCVANGFVYFIDYGTS